MRLSFRDMSEEHLLACATSSTAEGHMAKVEKCPAGGAIGPPPALSSPLGTCLAWPRFLAGCLVRVIGCWLPVYWEGTDSKAKASQPAECRRGGGALSRLKGRAPGPSIFPLSCLFVGLRRRYSTRSERWEGKWRPRTQHRVENSWMRSLRPRRMFRTHVRCDQ